MSDYEPKTDAGHTEADRERYPWCCERHRREFTMSDKIKIRVDDNEWYPWYSIVESTKGTAEIEVEPEKAAHWEAVLREAERVQEEIREIVRGRE